MKYDKLYDITVTLGTESIDYPNGTLYTKEWIQTIEDGGMYDISKLTMSAHSGTHIDAPSHFIHRAKSIDQYTIENFILPARVVEIEDKESIGALELAKVDVAPGHALLFKTHNSASGLCRNGVFSERFVYLTTEAADFCVTKKVSLLGIDYITIERYGDDTFPVHRKILGNNILILEGIDLKAVPPGKYTLFCLPLKIEGCEASPVRAVLLQP
jgi:arylformamidase